MKPNKTVRKIVGEKKIKCPKKCGKNVRRRSMETHITYCKHDVDIDKQLKTCQSKIEAQV